jgi:hypothetical protein
MTCSGVIDAYDARAAEYIRPLGGIEAAEADRDYVLDGARELTRPSIDVGCGPVRWTNGRDVTDTFRAAYNKLRGIETI